MKRYLSQLGAVSNGQIVLCAAVILSTITCALAFTAWGQVNDWELNSLSTYQIFPLLGLLAFSLLWSQYMTFGLSKSMHPPQAMLKTFFSVSHFFVLLLIVLHPGLLVWQLWRDGFGLPPGSYLHHFVAPDLGWVATLGTISFLVFAAYELRFVLGKHPWWHRIKYVSDVAMVAVFYHGFRLGDQLQGGWFRIVWLIYGVLLVLVLLYLRGGTLLKRRQRIKRIKRRSHEDKSSARK